MSLGIVLTVLAVALAALGTAWARPRKAAAAGLLGLGLLAAVAAAFGAGGGPTGERTLEVTHAFVAFIEHEMTSKDFAIETVSAPNWRWGVVALAWCGFWALLLWRGRPRADGSVRDVHPFWRPLWLAWTTLAAWLALEASAAPADLVKPFAIDRFLLPVSFAACWLLARSCRSLVLTLAWLSLFVTLARLPVVIFGTLATQRGWGTNLDVHSIDYFANPFAQRPVEVEPGSYEQLGWLLWAPHLFVFPALYMLSLGGIAFAIHMAAREAARTPATTT